MLLICTASSGKNLQLAMRLQELAAEIGLPAEVLDLAENALPLYSPQAEAEGTPEGFEAIESQFQRARGFVFCAPEYNGSIPPVLTSAVAWLSVSGSDFRSLFNGKPVGLATHSGGGGQKVLVAMRLHFAHLGANVLGRELQTNRNKPLNEDSARNVLTQLAAQLG